MFPNPHCILVSKVRREKKEEENVPGLELLLLLLLPLLFHTACPVKS